MSRNSDVLYNLFARCSNFLERFFISCHNFGFVNALKLFYGLYSNKHLKSVKIKRMRRKIYFRGKADIGVMSHFWKPLYHIECTKPNKQLAIIDAGANIGDETIRFQHFHPNATILAIEAEQDNFSVLKKNFQETPNVHCYHKALWYETTTLSLSKNSDSNESFRVNEETKQAALQVGTITIPELMQTHQLNEIDIIKLDIEGAEKALFSYNTDEWISKVNVFIFEIPDYDNPGTTRLIFEKLAAMNFNVFRSDESLVLIKADQPFRLHSILYY